MKGSQKAPMRLAGKVRVSTSESASEVEDRHEVLTAESGGGTDVLGKGQRRRLLDAVRKVLEAIRTEVDEKKVERIPRPPKRPSGKFKVLEIFTWSCMLSMVAVSRGNWEAFEPISLESGWNLESPQCQERAMEHLQEVSPDLLMLAWPCSPWSILQNANQRTPTQRRQLRIRRLRARRTLLAFTRRAMLWQRRRGKAVAAENPATSRAWDTPEIAEATDGLTMARFDQCQMGLCHPENGKPLKKLTQIAGQREVVQYLDGKKCTGDHEHHPIEGTYTTEEGKRAALSEFAGGYPPQLCNLLLDGAEAFYKKPQEAYVEEEYESDELAPEPIDGDEAIEEEDQLQEQIEEFPAMKKKEEDALEEEQRHPVSREVRKAVEYAHRQLGHPSRSTLLRMMRLSGANKEAIRYAQRWRCEVCAMRQRPRRPQAAAASVRPYGFNIHLHIDLKFVHDVRDKRYAVLSVLDLGTIKHDAVMIKTRRSDYVAGKFMRHWIMLYGVPKKITHDQGGEFEQSFTAVLEQFAITSEVTAAHAGWQLAAGERHGELLGTMLQAVVQEHSVEGYKEMKLALSAAVMAKNNTISRDGYTPNQRVFGMECRWPSLTDEDCAPSFAEAANTGSEVDRAHRMRVTARVALLRQDVRDKMKRAILRKPATAQGPFAPGTQIYFWTPGPKSRYSRTRGSIWRGPATVLVQEKHKRYFVSWRGRLLLLAEENMRLATKEELAMSEPIREEVLDLQGMLRDPMRSNAYEDLREIKPPPKRRKYQKRAPEPEHRKEAKRMMRGTKSVRRLLGSMQKGELKRVRRPRRVLIRSNEDRPRKAAKKDVEMDSEASPSIAPADEPPPQMDEVEPPPVAPEVGGEVQEIDDEDSVASQVEAFDFLPGPEDQEQEGRVRTEWDQLDPSAKRQRLLDDVPRGLKRKLVDRGDEDHSFIPEKQQRVSPGLVMQVLRATTEDGPDNEWVTRYELMLLRQLTGLPVTAARLHRAPRKKMMRPPKVTSRARLTVMIGRDPVDSFVSEETAEEVKKNPRRKVSFPWRGMTLFIRDPAEPKKDEQMYPTYIKGEQGLFEAFLTYEERKIFEEIWVEDTKNCLMAEIMLLKLKQSGKELDPKAFNEEEWAKFQASDAREWEQWHDNSVMRRVPPEEERNIPKSKIFRSPLRMVRVNKSGGVLLPLIAKSRLVVPGHLDPGLGMFRTDAPTTSLTATRLAKAVAAGRGWAGWAFDVSTAFLSGDPTQREIYVRAPAEGLPAVRGQSAIRPFELLQILKSAYGLTEAPRLWYLRANRNLEKTPLKELAAAKATYVASENGVSWALLCLHVDDGLLMGSESDPRFQALKKQIDGLFKIKEWKQVPLTFLGVDLKKDETGLVDDMTAYVKNIKVPEVTKKSPETPLDEKELTAFRQLVMRLRWPAQLAMPQVLYEVSLLAQKVSKATHGDFREAQALHKRFLQEAEAGRAALKYPKMEGVPFLVTYFDASLGKEVDGKSQLGAIHFLTDEGVMNGPRPACAVEFTTTKSSRVVRSSMAAEACSMSIAVDRHMYARLVLDMLLRGSYPVTASWREDCRVKGGVVTDAKSLYDHLSTTGQIPKERQTMLDLLASKHLLEGDLFKLFWVPTHRQFADVLTKKMKDILWEEFVKRGQISLVETEEERIVEEHRKELRKGQRQRRKVKMKSRGSAAKNT